jgi:hypothetical protein
MNTYEKEWLSNILFSHHYKLTSKDKLVATYLTLCAKEYGFYKAGFSFALLVSQVSGLAVRTVQKSMGRLTAIGAIKFVTDEHFILENL